MGSGFVALAVLGGRNGVERPSMPLSDYELCSDAGSTALLRCVEFNYGDDDEIKKNAGRQARTAAPLMWKEAENNIMAPLYFVDVAVSFAMSGSLYIIAICKPSTSLLTNVACWQA